MPNVNKSKPLFGSWPAVVGLPATVWATQTTRLIAQGEPCASFDRFNLALHVGDDPVAVQANRMTLLRYLAPLGVHQVVWLNQTHSTRVQVADGHLQLNAVDADALVTQHRGLAIAVMTADCLPIVLTDAAGIEIACVHAGWRGLLNGVIEATVAHMQHVPAVAWLGAAIGPQCFEVGVDVRAAFLAHDPATSVAFVPSPAGRWLADLYQLARLRLHAMGVETVLGGTHCTVTDHAQFYSFRHCAHTGRMATVAVLLPR
jgi:YfiH family protein